MNLKTVKLAVSEFNQYRSPEATARFVSKGQGTVRIDFSGPFCRTCGFKDYFDDFRIFLEEEGLKTRIEGIEETENGALVDFAIIQSS